MRSNVLHNLMEAVGPSLLPSSHKLVLGRALCSRSTSLLHSTALLHPRVPDAAPARRASLRLGADGPTGWRACRTPCALPAPRSELAAPAGPAASTVAHSTQLSTSGRANGGGTADAAPKSRGGFKVPPQEILDIVDAPPQPSLSYSPDRTMILQMERPPSLPPIFEMSRPELKLAGMRIDPELFASSKMSYYLDMAVVSADQVVPAPADQTRRVTGYPAGSWINYVAWSPDSRHVAFTVRSPGGPGDPPRRPLEIWLAPSATGAARPLLPEAPEGLERGLNAVFESYSWLDDDTILACMIPAGRGPAPTRPGMPLGPKVQDNSTGKKSQNRTYPDLLKDEHDARVFDYYCTSQIVTVDIHSGKVEKVGSPQLFVDVDASPDSRFLIVSWLERPYSYTVPCGRFPRRTQLWTRSGELVREIAALPLAEDIPIAFNSARKGPRGVSWRSDKPAELSWIEAKDGGDPAVEVSPRDVVYLLAADSASDPSVAPRELVGTDLRCGGVSWGDDELALVYESWWKTRRSVVRILAPGAGNNGKAQTGEVLFDRNYEDVYSDPGSPLTRKTEWGTYVLAKVDGKRQLLMEGSGASPEGNRPFLDLLDLDTKQTRRLWQSSPPFYESPGSIMSDLDTAKPVSLDGLQITLSRESSKDPPQTYIKTFGKDGVPVPGPEGERQVTRYPHPYPQLRDMSREVLRYPRSDGVMLTATLYLPPGYDKEKDGALPGIVWAYPREFKSKEAAGQNTRSPHQFASIGSSSPTLWVARGYAVLDGPTLPIVGEGDNSEPNDTFLQQLVDGAKAVLDEACTRRGVMDASRVSVGGHSYGAFMAANLLAHSELFACGVARTGAYNRTLTPFGFQNEERTLWQAPDVYMKMSPYMAADKIKRPLLLVHGEEDNNPGTFPMQSERFYQALKGHGATCRLVLLPHESHGYRARENVLHCLYEQDQWYERYAGYGRVDTEYYADDSAEETSGSE